MGKKFILIDDMEDNEVEADAGTYRLSLNGKAVELDLSTKNATKLEALLSPWFSRGRSSGKQTRARSAGAPSVKAKPTGSGYNSEQLAQVREWAGKQGIQVPARGRIKGDVLKAYEEAHAGGQLFSAS